MKSSARVSAAGAGLTIGVLASIYSVLAAPVPADPRSVGQIQRPAGRDRRVAPDLYPARPRDRDQEPGKANEDRARRTGRIEFQNVWFAYKDEDWVLKDVSFTVDVGESIALVGHTGSGKTTVTNLLMRFYDVQKGKILLDGVDVRDWDLTTCGRISRSCCRTCFCSAARSRTTSGSATKRSTANGSSGRRKRCMPTNLYSGWTAVTNSKVRERGAGLSVGQKQLISFARALAFDPKILILDEATSSIDTETEQLIQQAVERVMARRTSLVVAHRLSTIQRCDRIMVFHHGELRESGTHNELLANRGLYWRLYQLQYSDGSGTAVARP